MLSKTKKIHFIGIGGIGMSGIAELLNNLNFNITGSDIKKSERTDYLSDLGININIGHSANNITNQDLVVYSSAIKNDNIEIIETKNNSIPLIRRAEMLGELLKLNKTSVAISGTHGKTTTCSMLGSILIEAGLNPTLVIGGIINDFGSNSISGKGDIIVVEADEFDRSFLSLKPTIGLINNIDFEHSDCYKDLNDVKETFLSFANSLPFYGLIALCIDDKNIDNILNKIKRPYKTYGMSNKCNYRAKNIVYRGLNSSFDLYENNNHLSKINLSAAGLHNIYNSLAAITIARELEINIKHIKSGLVRYSGVKRRLEVINELDNGSLLIDDYAHHPSEVEASLSAIKTSFNKRVITIFQPHLFSRTQNFYNEFAKALSKSDITILLNIYPAREKPIEGVSSKLIYDEMIKLDKKNIYLDESDSIDTNIISDIYKDGDIIVTMGAGDINKYNKNILDAII